MKKKRIFLPKNLPVSAKNCTFGRRLACGNFFVVFSTKKCSNFGRRLACGNSPECTFALTCELTNFLSSSLKIRVFNEIR